MAASEVITRLAEDGSLERLIDCLPDAVVFVKDREARYVALNHTLVRRCGLADRRQLLGRRAADVFGALLGSGYERQDQEVLSTGRVLRRHLERHLYPGGHHGWCVTDKFPVAAATGEVVGLCGVSRDLPDIGAAWRGIAGLEDAIRGLLDGSRPAVRVRDVARAADMSEDALEDATRRVLGLTPRQVIRIAQIDEAAHRLTAGDESIATIAHSCGYGDQSAFTRAFRESTGCTPRDYRRAAQWPTP